MTALVRYELRKILTNRFGMGACVLALTMLVAYCTAQIVSKETFDFDTGRYVRGTAAIALSRERSEGHGPLTPEQVSADLATYRDALVTLQAIEGVGSEDGAPDGVGLERAYAEQGREAVEVCLPAVDDLVGNYYTMLDAFTTLYGADGTTFREVDLTRAAEYNLTQSLDQGHADGTYYTDAERALWNARLSEVGFPLRWGWSWGWQEFETAISILVFAIIAVCVTLSGVFAGEYQSGTAAVVLSCKHGKTTLVRAKVAAAFVFALTYYTLCVALAAALTLGFFGTGGFDLPVQSETLWSPYGWSVGQNALITLGLGYLVLVGCVAVTLLLSSKAQGPLPAAVVPMATILLGIVLYFAVPPLERILALLPWSLLGGSLAESLISYGLGPIAFDRVVIAPPLYLLVTLVCVPVAMRAFARHQVS